MDGPLSCLHLSVIVDNAAVNMGVLGSVWVPVFNYFQYIVRGGIAGWYGNSTFNFLKNHQAVFHSGCTSLHSHQQCMKILISPHSPQTLLFSVLFYSSHSDGCEVESPCDFDLHFPDDCRQQSIFVRACWPFVYLSTLSIFELGCLVFW